MLRVKIREASTKSDELNKVVAQRAFRKYILSLARPDSRSAIH